MWVSIDCLISASVANGIYPAPTVTCGRDCIGPWRVYSSKIHALSSAIWASYPRRRCNTLAKVSIMGTEVINWTGPAGQTPFLTASTILIVAVLRRLCLRDRISAMNTFTSRASLTIGYHLREAQPHRFGLNCLFRIQFTVCIWMVSLLLAGVNDALIRHQCGTTNRPCGKLTFGLVCHSVNSEDRSASAWHHVQQCFDGDGLDLRRGSIFNSRCASKLIDSRLVQVCTDGCASHVSFLYVS